MSEDTEREALGRIIWKTSRRDEGSISVMGANIVADAIQTEYLSDHDERVRAEVLAEVRAGLESLPQLRLKVGSSWMGAAWVVTRDAALAVVDGLEVSS